MKERFCSNGKVLQKNMKWQIGLDLQTWCIRFLPSSTDVAILRVKELSLKDVDKFGTASDDDDEDDDSDPNSYCLFHFFNFFHLLTNYFQFSICGKCCLWMSGLCYRHPLIFVKEKIPIERPYVHHVTFPEFFYLSESTIPKAGQGVFTTMALPSGVCFGPYSGFVSSSKEAEKSGYSWQLHQPDGKRVWVDAKNPFYSNWMRYVNCSRYEQEQNFVALLYNENIYYYTYKPVAAYEELLVWYGRDYGNYLNIKNALLESGPLAPVKEETIVNGSSYDSQESHESHVSDLLEIKSAIESNTESIEQVGTLSETT